MAKTNGERLAVSNEYLAGSIDADGCISIVKMKRTAGGKCDRHELRLHITNTDLRFLEIIQLQFGGSLKGVRSDNNRNPKWKTAYSWRTQGKNAEDIIKRVFPYLIIKKDRAEVALELRKTITNGQRNAVTDEILERRESLYLRMKTLNKRGV